jgi:hypothetical protein
LESRAVRAECQNILWRVVLVIVILVMGIELAIVLRDESADFAEVLRYRQGLSPHQQKGGCVARWKACEGIRG